MTRFFFTPVLTPLIQNRRIILILGGVAALQVWLTAVGIPGWQCPIKASLGIQCPGCGLSSAMALLIQGEWRAALHVHAFAPFFLVGFALMMIIGILPERAHLESVRLIAMLERRTAFTPILLISIIVYWVLRFTGLL
ncbi:MAG: DUF2752 domain-containing protein [Desulfobacteraceae bacterium]|nr:MAG: DUF2752 domain-containing protein [Desulfobacteraceae bacterium]